MKFDISKFNDKTRHIIRIYNIYNNYERKTFVLL